MRLHANQNFKNYANYANLANFKTLSGRNIFLFITDYRNPDENGLCKRNDDKAISICDEAYKKATPSGHFTIVLTVTPFGNGLDNQSTTIKSWEN